jgi:coenzyme F420 hydrogenase subunit delta
VDIAEYDAEPGTLRMFTVDEIPKASYEDVHSWPVNQPLHTLAEKVDVKVLGCKPQEVSAPDVVLGLTEPVEKAIPQAIKMILNEIGV